MNDNVDTTPAALTGSFIGSICVELLYALLLWWVLKTALPIFGIKMLFSYKLCLGISVLIRGLFK